MSQSMRVALEFTTAVVDSTTATFMPRTAWRRTGGIASARASCEMRARGGSANLLGSPAVQMTNDVRTPASTVQIKITGGETSGFANANGVFDPDPNGPQTLDTQDYLYIREGWLVKAVAAGSAHGQLGGSIEYFY